MTFDPTSNRKNVFIKGPGFRVQQLPEPTKMHHANPLTQLLQPGDFKASKWTNNKF